MFNPRNHLNALSQKILSLSSSLSAEQGIAPPPEGYLPGETPDDRRESLLMGGHFTEHFLAPILPRYYASEPGWVYFSQQSEFLFAPAHFPSAKDGLPGLPGTGMDRNIFFPIVIRDAMRYPVFREEGFSVFPVQSVRVVADCKLRYTRRSLDLFMAKMKPLRPYGFSYRFTRPAFEEDYEGDTEGGEEVEELFFGPSIRSVQFFLQAGEEFSTDALDLSALSESHYEWPDLMLFLEEGKVLIKEYVKIIVEDRVDSIQCSLRLFLPGRETLLLFTDFLMNDLLPEAGGLDLSNFTDLIKEYPAEEKEYPIVL